MATSKATRTAETEGLQRHLNYLKLFFIAEHLEEFAKLAAEEHWDHVTFVARLIEGEAQRRQDRSVERRVRLARFPVCKTLEQFQWTWPKKVNRAQVQNLFRLKFLDDNSNVVFIGGVGLGKSHLSIALGLAACHQGHSVLFTSAIDVIYTLAGAQAAGRL